MAKSEPIDKTKVLDSCVDGDETRFNNLIGKDYEQFNVIYDVVKQNKTRLDANHIKCTYDDNTSTLNVRIPTTELTTTKLMLPVDKQMDSMIHEGELVLNIAVKKE